MTLNQLSEAVIGACIEVHRNLGPGLLESTYEQCLCRELSLRNIPFEFQVPLPVNYKGMLLDCGYRLDLIVDGRLVIELKAIEAVLPIREAQLMTYLKLGHWQLGLLINFNVQMLKDGITRRVMGLKE